tara:strand:- start:2265 stop:3893 length:1629 start_codon:yes stop_codon:yes gene_type:complete
MEYFLKYPKFNVLKNHIMKDSLSDWFEINHNKYTKDENKGYKNYIIKESKNYKLSVLKKILELSGLEIPLQPTFNQTKELLYNDSQLILQGILLNKNDIFVDCDLIITYKLFKKLFPKINNLPFHLYCKNDNDYLLIDICYSTLHFKIDLKDVQNEGIIFYKKCKLFSFREVFYELSGQHCECFMLGKEYFYKNTLLPKKEFIAKIEYNEKIQKALLDSINWIRYLKNNHHKLTIIPTPNHINLYPNMNYNYSDWENEKVKLANQIKEITLVWNISYEERCDLLKKDIKSWDDPKILSELKESKKKDIQERMIHMNQQEDILIYPRKNVSHNFKEIIKSSDTDIYFDVESFLSFDEKQSLFTDSMKVKEPIIGILGFIYDKTFYNVTINEFTKNDEERMIKQFSSYLYKISKNKMINIYHWGHAENNYFKYIHETYPKILFPKYRLINVLDYFRTEPIIVQGIFKFGIKSVGKALYKHGLIKTTWEENDNGLESMIQFKESCIKKDKNIPLKRYLEVSEIIEYNHTDCQVLFEIVELLREKY